MYLTVLILFCVFFCFYSITVTPAALGSMGGRVGYKMNKLNKKRQGRATICNKMLWAGPEFRLQGKILFSLALSFRYRFAALKTHQGFVILTCHLLPEATHHPAVGTVVLKPLRLFSVEHK